MCEEAIVFYTKIAFKVSTKSRTIFKITKKEDKTIIYNNNIYILYYIIISINMTFTR